MQKKRKIIKVGSEKSECPEFFIGDIVVLRRTHRTLDHHSGGWATQDRLGRKYKIVGKDSAHQSGRTWECYILEDLTTGKILKYDQEDDGHLFAGVWIDLDPFMTAVNEAINHEQVKGG